MAKTSRNDENFKKGGLAEAAPKLREMTKTSRRGPLAGGAEGRKGAVGAVGCLSVYLKAAVSLAPS